MVIVSWNVLKNFVQKEIGQLTNCQQHRLTAMKVARCLSHVFTVCCDLQFICTWLIGDTMTSIFSLSMKIPRIYQNMLQAVYMSVFPITLIVMSCLTLHIDLRIASETHIGHSVQCTYSEHQPTLAPSVICINAYTFCMHKNCTNVMKLLQEQLKPDYCMTKMALQFQSLLHRFTVIVNKPDTVI